MTLKALSLEELQIAADSALEEAGSRLRDVLSELATRLRPFPSFWNMVSIQAIEVEPPIRLAADMGCVVVCPDGTICELDLQSMPGIPGVNEADQVEQLQDLSLSPAEYIIYATTAIRMLRNELVRRSR